jgi:integration host factor subunit alpha
MTKADLVDLIHERVGSPKKEAGEVVEAVFGIIRESLRDGSKVKISGFGTFIVSHKHARRGRNPQTNTPITICSRRVLSFKPSQVLKDRVNQGLPPGSLLFSKLGNYRPAKTVRSNAQPAGVFARHAKVARLVVANYLL